MSTYSSKIRYDTLAPDIVLFFLNFIILYYTSLVNYISYDFVLTYLRDDFI